jgi:hypothetical protein
MKDQLVFDTTNAGTITDSDKTLAGIISTDGSTLITDTLSGGKQGLDVYVINPVDTTAGAEKAEDAAHSSGDTGNFVLAVANHTEGALHSADGDYAALQVDDTGRLRVVADIDVTNQAEKAEDSAHTSGDIGSYSLTVRQDTLASSTSADGDYQSFKTDALGRLYTVAPVSDALLTTIDADTSVIAGDTTSIDATLTALSKAEDAAHSSGDQGIQMLAVRQDTLSSSVSADGDYGSLKLNSDGRLYVDAILSADPSVSETAIANTATSVGNTATDLVGTDLTGREYVAIYNNGNQRIYVGGSGVSVATGFPVAPKSYIEMRAGAAIDLHAIASVAGQDTRILELS